MSSDQSVQSDSARRTISRFTATAWVVGAVIMAIIAFSTFARVGVNGDTGALFEVDGGGGGGYGDYPWEDDGVAIAESTDGRTFSADGDAVIRMPTPTTDPLRIDQTTDVDVRLSQTASGDIDPDIPADDREWPESIGYPRDDVPTVAFPYEGTTEIWVEADEPWTLEFSDLGAEEVTDIASGSGNGLLIYRGDSVSAMFTFKGEGIFFVTAFTREMGDESLIIESDPLSERHTWEPSDSIVFLIESDADRGAWSVDIDQYADSPSSTPAPTPAESADPSAQPDAQPGTEPPTEQETP